jgi:sodium/potassium-transporting ATPase subunit alpha
LQKVTLYLLPAGSWSELLPVLANFFLGLPLPLSAFLMIVICMLTDLCPSLALVKEVPERDIMKRRPVVRSVSHLVNWRLLFHAYACIGMIESFSAFFCWFSFFHSQGLPPGALFFAFDSYSDGYYGKSQDELDELLYRGQSIFFVALVVTQLANLLSSRTRYVSFFSHSPLYGPSRNLWLFVAMAVSIAIAVLITQVPFFNSTFHTRSVPVRDVAPAIGFGAAIFVLDEARKRYIQQYPTSRAAWMAW